MDLEILPVKSLPEYDVEKLKKLHINLPKPPFLGILQGSVRSGKSNLVMNLIYNKHFYRGIFDRIFYISPTVNNDLTLQFLKNDEDVDKITDNLDDIDDIVKEIVNHKKEDEELKEEQWLFVLDDMIGLIKNKGYISSYATKFRHDKNSLIFLSQNFRSIPPIIRVNAGWYCIWKTTNHKEYSKIEDEFSSLFPNFIQLYNESTDKPYNFLFLDLKKIKAYHNFNKLLYSK